MSDAVKPVLPTMAPPNSVSNQVAHPRRSVNSRELRSKVRPTIRIAHLRDSS